MDSSHRWLRIFETTDHTKILESQDYGFKVFVILIFYRKKRPFQEVQCDKTKIPPNMTERLKQIFAIIIFKHDQLFHGLSTPFVKNP